MADLDLRCLAIPLPPKPPKMDLPGLGTLQQAWDTLGGIPSARDLVAKFMNAAQQALAPVRRFLEMVEVATAIQQCLMKIPDAITSLDPTELFDCFEELYKKVARILTYFPPLSYIKMGVDIAGFCIDLIDAGLQLLTEIDSMIQDYINIASIAAAAADQELQSMLQCGISEAGPPVIQLCDAMLFIKPAMNTLLDPFIRLGYSGLQPAKVTLELVDVYLLKVRLQLESGGGSQSPLPPFPGFSAVTPTMSDLVPFPPLGPLIFAMGLMRDQLVLIYNLLSAVLGGDRKAVLSSLPTFGSF